MKQKQILTIGQILSKEEMKEEWKHSPLCKNSLKSSELCLGTNDYNSVIAKEQDIKLFLQKYSPDKQYIICQNADSCFFGKSPTLSELSKEYGSGLPKAWLIPQLVNLSEFCGLKERASAEQLKELALIIFQQYYWLKIEELMLFFYRFKCKYYLRFYSYFDPMTVLESLVLFTKERAEEYLRKENEERETKEKKHWAEVQEYRKALQEKKVQTNN